MNNLPMTFTWKGKSREDLTREELYEVIDYLSKAKESSENSLKSVIDIQRLAMKKLCA